MIITSSGEGSRALSGELYPMKSALPSEKVKQPEEGVAKKGAAKKNCPTNDNAKPAMMKECIALCKDHEE